MYKHNTHGGILFRFTPSAIGAALDVHDDSNFDNMCSDASICKCSNLLRSVCLVVVLYGLVADGHAGQGYGT